MGKLRLREKRGLAEGQKQSVGFVPPGKEQSDEKQHQQQ